MDKFAINSKNLRQVLHTIADCEHQANDTEEIVILKFKTVLHARHDLLHIVVCEHLGQLAILGATEKIGVIFPQFASFTFAKLSPDILIQTDSLLHVIDVTITTQIEYTRQEKMAKYQQLSQVAEELGLDFQLSIIAIAPSLENILTEFLQATVLPNDELLKSFYSFYGKASKSVESLKPFVRTDAFEHYEFGVPIRTEFKSCHDYKHVRPSTHLDALTVKNDWMDVKSVMETMIQLSDDEDIVNVLKDRQHNQNDFNSAFSELDDLEPNAYSKPKPTYHVLYTGDEFRVPRLPQYEGYKNDQQNTLCMLDFLVRLGLKDDFGDFIRELYSNLQIALLHVHEKKVFETGFYTGTYDGDQHLKKVIASEKGVADKDKVGISIRKNNDISRLDLRTEKPYFERSHQINISLENPNARLFDNKSGVAFKSKHPAGRTYKSPTSCAPQCGIAFDEFIETMARTQCKAVKVDPLFDQPVGSDAECAMLFKKQSRESFKGFFKQVSRTQFHSMSFHTMLFADQAIHYSSLNTKKESYCLVNTGLSNVLHILHGGSLPRSHDVGQPFFSIAITTNRSWASDVFGDHRSIPFFVDGKAGFIIVTGWRRLQIHKLAILRDQYYSCLSTGFDTFCRNQSLRGSRQDFIFFVYGFKTLVAQATGQRAAEFLMDVRYVVMSCYADYTNVSALIKDKFAPHYPTCFTRWIIKTLRSKVGSIQQAYQSTHGFVLNQPIFAGENRVQSSLGGDIDFPSLWGNYRLKSLQDLLDELFVYVLTGKEPSSQFHESIKSVETILKFQRIHDDLSDKEKNGEHTFNTLKENIIKRKAIFYWNNAIYTSASLLSNTLDTNRIKKTIQKNTNLEVLSDIESTKACIPEYELTTDLDYAAKPVSLSSLREHLVNTGFTILGDYKYQPCVYKDVVKGSPVNPKSKSGRAKVHDLQLDMLIRHPELETTLDLAHWNMFSNQCRVEAHVCIKAQYGAKREFYVVNHGAKAQVRIFENIFKSIAKYVDNEMISVPGDQKMEYMAKSVNKIITESKGRNDTIMYTNGDCTKWSACETMGSFISLVRGFRALIDEPLQEFCLTHLCSWADKVIRIPRMLLEGTKFITEKTLYFNQEGTIKSTQNFLQGMFNYSSSVKSVCATDFAIKAWVYKWGHERPINVKHLEHSDDYVLIVRVRDIRDFEDFRIMHKLSQRLHGIVDSEKKTNSQRFIMEFISLMCFNGQLSYPHIKKTKETGINIAGLGYQADIMNVVSRASESVRLGVPQCSAYVQSLLQGINIFRKYALQPGGRNATPFSKDTFNTPIELFGLPDCLPVFYLNTLGDPNNFRIFKYGDPIFRKYFWGLYKYSQKINAELSIFSNQIPTFKTYNYIFKKTGTRLQSIKKNLNWGSNDVSNFLADNPEYILMKPRNRLGYIQWLQYMYYNPSFATAYTQLSRRMILLRLSFFASGQCISSLIGNKVITLSEFIRNDLPLLCDQDEPNLANLKLILLNSDPNIEAYFNLLDGASLIRTGSKPLPTSVFKIPESYSFLSLENDLSTVIQYTFNSGNFIKDQRRHLGELSLERDKKKITPLIGDSKKGPATILTLHKLLRSQIKKYTVGISFSPAAHLTPGDMFRGYIEGGLEYDAQYQLYTKQDFVVTNPLTNEPIYSRDFLYEDDRNSLILEQLSLTYYLVVVKLQLSVPVFRKMVSVIVDTFTGTPVLDLLHAMKYDLANQADQFHKRMYTFFKYVLDFDMAPITQLIEHSFGIRHTYLDQFDLKELKDAGLDVEDAVMFTFKGVAFLAVKQSGIVYSLSHTSGPATQLLSIIIAKRLFNDISQNTFEKQFTERLDYPAMVTDDNLKTTHELVRLNLEKGKNLYWARTASGFNAYSGFNLPIKKMPKFLSMPIELYIDMETAIVKNKRTKLFSLPFWPCGSYQALTFGDFELGKGVNLSLFNEHKLLYSYFHTNEISVVYDERIVASVAKAFGDLSINQFDPPKSEAVPRKPSVRHDFAFEDLGAHIGTVELDITDDIDFSLLMEDSIEFREDKDMNVEDMREVLEMADYEIELDLDAPDLDLELDLDNEVNVSPASTSSDDEPFIQLLEKSSASGFVLQHIQSLPPVHVYILRCHTNYEYVRAVRKPSAAFSFLKIAYKMSKDWDNYTPLEQCIMNYIIYEITEHTVRHNYDYQPFKVGTNVIQFNGSHVNVSSCRKFFTEAAANRFARRGGIVTVDSNEGFLVTTQIEEDDILLLWHTLDDIPEGKHKTWKIIIDLQNE